jgi:hypothetical protein
LKQARQRASRLFLKDGARSSLPQYLQTNFLALNARDDPSGRCAAFLVFERIVAFGLAATAFFFIGAVGSTSEATSGGPAIILPFSLRNAPVAGWLSVSPEISFSG